MEDYNKIKELVDDIIGINTKQGETLKLAIKNYFETKPKKYVPTVYKTVNNIFSSDRVARITAEADKALKKYALRLNKVNRRK